MEWLSDCSESRLERLWGPVAGGGAILCLEGLGGAFTGV